MPEAIKEGVGAADVAAPEDTAPPPLDLATDGVVEVKPPPATEPSLPVGQVQPNESGNNMQEVGETAPDVIEPPTEQSCADKAEPQPSAESKVDEIKVDPKAELDEMVAKGRALLRIKGDCYAAAEVLTKACEKASEIYGELSEHCGDLYFLYGCSMLDCGKTENNVLGENIKDKDKDEENEAEDEDEEEEEENKEENDEDMEVEDKEDSAEVGTSNGAKNTNDNTSEDVSKADDEDDDESSLKVAWEMFELAKVAFTRLGNKEKLADTLMKLGEVGIESGHNSAVNDMLLALDIRQTLYPNGRIIPETHFNIGLGYSMFEMFDEAITHFEKSKSLLEDIITNLENLADEKSLKEAKEIKDILPELSDKIQDMKDSKRDRRKEMEEILKNGLASASKESSEFSAGTSTEAEKPASNITHLIKRKRKIDEVTSDLPNKVAEEPKRKLKAVEKEAEEESLNADKGKTNSEEAGESKTLVETITEEEVMEVDEEDINIIPDKTSNNTEKLSSEDIKETNVAIADITNSNKTKLEKEETEVVNSGIEHKEETNTQSEVTESVQQKECVDNNTAKETDAQVSSSEIVSAVSNEVSKDCDMQIENETDSKSISDEEKISVIPPKEMTESELVKNEEIDKTCDNKNPSLIEERKIQDTSEVSKLQSSNEGNQEEPDSTVGKECESEDDKITKLKPVAEEAESVMTVDKEITNESTKTEVIAKNVDSEVILEKDEIKEIENKQQKIESEIITTEADTSSAAQSVKLDTESDEVKVEEKDGSVKAEEINDAVEIKDDTDKKDQEICPSTVKSQFNEQENNEKIESSKSSDNSMNGVEGTSKTSSKIDTEEVKVTNGCTATSVQPIKTTMDSVVAKELCKDESDSVTSVAC